MRRKDREGFQTDEILSVLDRCQVFRLGIQDRNGIYIVPMNFGYTYEEGVLTLYFHSAKEGRKIDCLKSGGSVGFELDCSHELLEDDLPCTYGSRFESVIGTGRVSFLTDESEKAAALICLMRHQTGKSLVFTPEMTRAVEVFCLCADVFSCKRHE